MPKTLLLADDSVTIQKVVGISFASEDIAITTVDNGNDAVDRARELRPDVILADVVMPGLSGYEVCEAVKGDPDLRHIPVLLLTGTFEAFDEARAEPAGAAGHVAKPFEAQTLVDRVKQILAASPPAEAAADPAPSAPPPTAAGEIAEEVPEATTDAFDFFSDDDGDAARVDPLSDASLDLDEPDAAFAFGDEELAPAAQEPLPAAPLAGSPPDATVAILPDSPGGDLAEPANLSFEEPALEAPVSPDALAHTALLDPAAGADLDVSSSDLAVELPEIGAPGEALDAPAAATPLEVLDEDPFAAPAPAASDGDRSEPEEPEAAIPGLGRDPILDELSPPPAAAEVDSLPRPYGVDVDPAVDPGDTVPGRSGPLAPPPLPEVEAEPLDASPPPPIPGSDAGAEALSPAMREELHDTLEKIAWDAFGQVTEKIVREAIERIERVAWEVVPKLAETLIQEEIRRLKDGGSGS